MSTNIEKLDKKIVDFVLKLDPLDEAERYYAVAFRELVSENVISDDDFLIAHLIGAIPQIDPDSDTCLQFSEKQWIMLYQFGYLNSFDLIHAATASYLLFKYLFSVKSMRYPDILEELDEMREDPEYGEIVNKCYQYAKKHL